MSRQSINHVFKIVVVIWLTLSIASVILAGITWIQLSLKLKASAEAIAFRETVSGVLERLLEIEGGQRGFTITGDDSFLKAHDEAETQVFLLFDRLADSARRDSSLVKEVMNFRAQAETALVAHRKVLAVRREQGIEAAAALVRTDEGRRAMDNIRLTVGKIRGTPYALTSPESLGARGQLLRASLTSLVAGALGIGAGALALVLALRGLKGQQREKQLTKARVEAERTSHEKTEFLANMSHEIRTPMNAILGFSELLGGELADPKHRQYLQSIRSSAHSLLQLINDVLDISKIEAGALVLRPEPTDPREVCDFIKTAFVEAATRKGVILDCHIAKDLPGSLLLDRIRLRQILVNMVGNAVKFTDKGKVEIRVSWEKQERSQVTLFVEVQDTGVGIPHEKLNAIFQPFVQADASRAKEGQGTGLGLSIVKRLTEAMNGTVTVESVVGQGSVFQLRLPDVPLSARLASPEPDEQGEPVNFNDLRPATLLIVDDNALNCQLLAAMFEGTHHRVVFGCNGREAVEKARRLRPEIALLDIRMPEVDGQEALTQIRQTAGLEMMPIIAVTASSLLDQERILREKFSGYLRKPFTQRQLFGELAHFLPRQLKADASASPMSTLPAAGTWRDLVLPLRSLLGEEWPALRDSVAVNETIAFARRLEDLGHHGGCQLLLSYAETLSGHAKVYAVDALEKHLGQFPTLVAQVEGFAQHAP